MRSLLLLLAFTVGANAEEACPWMNAATASGLLGGDAAVKFVHAGKAKDDGECDFIRSPPLGHLLIHVATMDSPASQFKSFLQQCGATGVPVKAIGNQAVECSLPEASRQAAVRVVSRVRERAFVVTLMSPQATNVDAMLETAKQAAELVAGNLF